MEKEIVYIDMDNVIVDFKSGLDKVSPNVLENLRMRAKATPFMKISTDYFH